MRFSLEICNINRRARFTRLPLIISYVEWFLYILCTTALIIYERKTPESVCSFAYFSTVLSTCRRVHNFFLLDNQRHSNTTFHSFNFRTRKITVLRNHWKSIMVFAIITMPTVNELSIKENLNFTEGVFINPLDFFFLNPINPIIKYCSLYGFLICTNYVRCIRIMRRALALKD